MCFKCRVIDPVFVFKILHSKRVCSEQPPSSGQPIPHAVDDSHVSSLIYHTTSSQSRPPPPPLPLYPPFYNRLPTPLAPSPSLTSLPRPPSPPNRSTTSARPTTPDFSDAKTPNDAEAAVAHSARRATVVERIALKVPTHGNYGIVLYLVSSLALLA